MAPEGNWRHHVSERQNTNTSPHPHPGGQGASVLSLRLGPSPAVRRNSDSMNSGSIVNIQQETPHSAACKWPRLTVRCATSHHLYSSSSSSPSPPPPPHTHTLGPICLTPLLPTPLHSASPLLIPAVLHAARQPVKPHPPSCLENEGLMESDVSAVVIG